MGMRGKARSLPRWRRHCRHRNQKPKPRGFKTWEPRQGLRDGKEASSQDARTLREAPALVSALAITPLSPNEVDKDPM